MIPLYSTNQIREIDKYTVSHLKIPSIVLMENASLEIFHFITSGNFQLPAEPLIGIICGKGNNAGDGFAAARHLSNAGLIVKVIHTHSPEQMSIDCRTNYEILKRLQSTNKNLSVKKFESINDIRSLKNCSLIMDAMLGSGFTGDLKEPFAEIVQSLNAINCIKVAVDIPTGLNVDTGFTNLAFKADYTITLGEFKPGLFYNLGSIYSGEVVRGNIGISDNLYEDLITSTYLIEPEDALRSLPIKKKDLHKYSAGKVLTIAGSGKLPGAAVITSKSVLSAGAGASILAFPKSIRSLIHKKISEVVVETYDDQKSENFSESAIEELKGKLRWADVVAIGPGLWRSDRTQAAVLKLLKQKREYFLVIDADAISALANGKFETVNLKNSILTPHHGEFSNLLGISTLELQKNILNFGRNFSISTKSILILKGSPTIIFTPSGDSLINTTGNPGLAKFGSGDVLTGLIAGILAQGKDLEKASIAGVYLHSLAADILRQELTEYSFSADHIIKAYPKAIKFLRKSLD